MTETDNGKRAKMIDAIRRHPWAAALVALFAALATTYSLVSPIFEVSDEYLHYPVVHHISTIGQLPVQQPGIRTMWEQEGSQPPLYYLMGAALTFWIDTGDLPEVRRLNPHAKLGIPLDPDNKNIIIHGGGEQPPWHGTVLAVHLIRFLSVAFGAGSVALTYAIAHTLLPENRWFPPLAATLVAFNPMYLFITGSVNNDSLMVLLGSWVLLLVVRVLKYGLSPQRAATLAVVVALGTLTKISGLTFLPVVGLALAIHARRTGRWREAILSGLGIAAAWAVLAGWWYARNLRLYGELLGTQTMIAVAGGRETITLAGLAREWYGFWVSYWALFGGVSILADQIVYPFLAVVSWIAVGGLAWLVYRAARRRAWDQLLIPGVLAFQVAVTFAALVRWTMITYGSQGRLMFPAIGAISSLMALGLVAWVPRDWRPAPLAAVGVPLLAVAAIAPFRYIAPAYAPPPIVEQIPADATAVGLDFDGLEIVAIGAHDVNVEEGGRVPVTVYLRANRAFDVDYSLYLHALGRDDEEIGKIDTYPGGGALPTTHMQPGVIYADDYSLELDPSFDAPTALRIAVGVGFWERPRYTVLSGRLPDGTETASAIVDAGVAYPAEQEVCTAQVSEDTAPTATLGGFAQVWAGLQDTVAEPGDEIAVRLVWDRLADTPHDWTVFLHLVGPDGQVVAQADGQPLNGDYPTSLWRRPCQVEGLRTLHLPSDLPAGTYQVVMGLYNLADPALPRAQAAAPDGSPYPDNVIPLGTVRVAAR